MGSKIPGYPCCSKLGKILTGLTLQAGSGEFAWWLEEQRKEKSCPHEAQWGGRHFFLGLPLALGMGAQEMRPGPAVWELAE